MMATPIATALDAQGILQPGQEGYWQVWGARASDIRHADLVMVKGRDGQVREYAVAEPAPWGDIRDIAYPRFRDESGELFSVGALQPVVVLRRGTRHTLADSI
jgi:hypothetical protein